jgi:hypothetical protein
MKKFDEKEIFILGIIMFFMGVASYCCQVRDYIKSKNSEMSRNNSQYFYTMNVIPYGKNKKNHLRISEVVAQSRFQKEGLNRLNCGCLAMRKGRLPPAESPFLLDASVRRRTWSVWFPQQHKHGELLVRQPLLYPNDEASKVVLNISR